MGLVEVTPPTNEPVSRDDAKDHLRILNSDDDAYIDSLIKVARQKVEIDTNRALTNTVYKKVLDCFPAGRFIELERAPLVSISSIQYYDTDGDLQTFNASNYLAQVHSEPGYVELKYELEWPDVRDESQAVIINYTAGYGTDSASVPETLRHAIKFLISHWYSMREPVTSLTQLSTVPMTYQYLTQPYRVHP